MALAKPLKILLWVLLGVGILIGAFFLFCWGMIEFVGDVGKDLGF